MATSQSSRNPVDVLIVDRDPSQRRALAGAINDRSLGRFIPRVCADAAEALTAVEAGSRAILIADLDTIGGADRIGDFSRGATNFIATSASSSLNLAVAAVRAGAIDFMPKPIGAKALIDRLDAAIASWSRPQAPRPARRTSAETPELGGFIGRSPAMQDVYGQIRRMAPSKAPVFITGESGTGKEVCAEAIHQHGGEDGRPFVAINCSAIPRELMESEIFGHVRGAFTGASENRPGAAELANGGTLFLDEICEMDLGLQAKLLRFIQSGTVRRVGGTETKPVDVRIVSATNRDPLAEVAAGGFRADLFYRLHVLPIHLPPLRERSVDIIPLADAFLRRYASEEGRAFVGFAPDAEALIAACPWPGNVRQLQNVIRRIVVLHDGNLVTPAMLPPAIATGGGSRAAEPPPARPATIAPYWQQEREIIETAIAAFGGSVSRAAAALELSPSTIYRKRQAWAEQRTA